MQEYSINIESYGLINSAFVKANTALAIKYSEKLLRAKDKEKTLIDLWKKEYRATLVKDDSSFCRIEFDDLQGMTIFLLKYN